MYQRWCTLHESDPHVTRLSQSTHRVSASAICCVRFLRKAGHQAASLRVQQSLPVIEQFIPPLRDYFGTSSCNTLGGHDI